MGEGALTLSCTSVGWQEVWWEAGTVPRRYIRREKTTNVTWEDELNTQRLPTHTQSPHTILTPYPFLCINHFCPMQRAEGKSGTVGVAFNPSIPEMEKLKPAWVRERDLILEAGPGICLSWWSACPACLKPWG